MRVALTNSERNGAVAIMFDKRKKTRVASLFRKYRACTRDEIAEQLALEGYSRSTFVHWAKIEKEIKTGAWGAVYTAMAHAAGHQIPAHVQETEQAQHVYGMQGNRRLCKFYETSVVVLSQVEREVLAGERRRGERE